MAFYVENIRIGGIADLCKRLKIDERDIPYRKRNKEFEQRSNKDSMGNPKRDANGNYETKRKIAGSPVFTVYVKNEGEVQVRLATNQRKDKDQNFVYTPTLITMDPGEDGSISYNDENEFVFWFLHPWNLQSPFHDKAKPYFFEYKDNELKHKTDNDKEEDRIMALSFVFGRAALSISKLRTIAKGMNVDGVDDLSDETVKAALKAKAIADPLKFTSEIDSREIMFSGRIQDAIDKRVLTLESLNGMQRWFLNGKEVVPVVYGQDALQTLQEEFSSKWYLYQDDMERGLKAAIISDNLKSEDNSEMFSNETLENGLPESAVTQAMRELEIKVYADNNYGQQIKKLSLIEDINDPSIHAMTKKSYNEKKEDVELWKQYQAILAQEKLETV